MNMTEPIKVDKIKQLKIDKKGLILVFKDRHGCKNSVKVSEMRALLFGGIKFIYANDYIPLPIGSNQFIIKNKTKDVL